jgi:hypothetical protein
VQLVDSSADTWIMSQCRHNIQFDVIVINRCAGAEFKPITNLIAEGIECIGRTEALGAAIHTLTPRHEPITTRFHCYVEFHNEPNLRPGIDLVNYRHNNGPQRRLAVFHNLPR